MVRSAAAVAKSADWLRMTFTLPLLMAGARASIVPFTRSMAVLAPSVPWRMATCQGVFTWCSAR